MITREEIEVFTDAGPVGWPVVLRHREDAPTLAELARLALVGLALAGLSEEQRGRLAHFCRSEMTIALVDRDGCEEWKSDMRANLAAVLAALEALR